MRMVLVSKEEFHDTIGPMDVHPQIVHSTWTKQGHTTHWKTPLQEMVGVTCIDRQRIPAKTTYFLRKSAFTNKEAS